MIQCIVWIMAVFNMYCVCVVCNWLNLVSPSLGVASLRPRMGGEPPWFPIFIILFVGCLGALKNLDILSWHGNQSTFVPYFIEKEDIFLEI